MDGNGPSAARFSIIRRAKVSPIPSTSRSSSHRQEFTSSRYGSTSCFETGGELSQVHARRMIPHAQAAIGVGAVRDCSVNSDMFSAFRPRWNIASRIRLRVVRSVERIGGLDSQTLVRPWPFHDALEFFMPPISRVLFLVALIVCVTQAPAADEPKAKPKKQKVVPYESGIPWAEPEKVDPGKSTVDPPSDAVVLFDGTNLDAWDGDVGKWKIQDGYGIAGSRIRTKQAFGDCQLHIEFRSPESEAKDQGQKRSNNGIGFMDARYEVQVLDSHSSTTYPDGQATAVYKQHPPLVNASLPTGTWQTYDILFKAPKFNEDGSLSEAANVTVFHNGVVTQWNFELKGDTPYNRPPAYKKHPEKMPFTLMFHGDPVEFRNIWMRDLSGDAGIAQVKKEEPQEEKPAEEKK